MKFIYALTLAFALSGCVANRPVKYTCEKSTVEVYTNPARPGETVVLPLNPCGYDA